MVLQDHYTLLMGLVRRDIDDELPMDMSQEFYILDQTAY